jgi:hypothetical protein
MPEPRPQLSDLPRRVGEIEKYIEEQRKFNAQLNESAWAIKMAMEKGLNTMEKALGDINNRVKVHDDRRRFWIKVWGTIVGAMALIIIGWAMKISWMVQSNKLVP